MPQKVKPQQVVASNGHESIFQLISLKNAQRLSDVAAFVGIPTSVVVLFAFLMPAFYQGVAGLAMFAGSLMFTTAVGWGAKDSMAKFIHGAAAPQVYLRLFGFGLVVAFIFGLFASGHEAAWQLTISTVVVALAANTFFGYTARVVIRKIHNAG